LSGREKRKGSGGWFFGDCGGGWDAGDGTAIVVLLILLILLAEFFLVYAIAIAFTYILSLGEARRAKRYFKKVERLGLVEPEGTGIARSLDRTKIYFSIVFFIFAAEETIRFVLHTGSATFGDVYGLAVWGFRFACLAAFIVITSLFLVRLHQWRSFTSTPAYEKAQREIEAHEAWLHKAPSP
jgi:hypothetical protein